MRGFRTLVFVVLVAFAGVGCSTTSKGGSGGIDPGLGTQDASGDVSLGSCSTDFGVVTCTVNIVNHSGGTSDYFIEATMTDSSGANVGTANALATGVAAGQTAKTDLTGVPAGGSSGVKVRITQVQRTAS